MRSMIEHENTVKFNISFEPSLMKEIDKIAAAKYISRSLLVRQLAREYVETTKSKMEQTGGQKDVR